MSTATEPRSVDETDLRQVMGALIAHQAAVNLLIGVAAKGQNPELGEEYFGSIRQAVDRGLFEDLMDSEMRAGFLDALDRFANLWAEVSGTT